MVIPFICYHYTYTTYFLNHMQSHWDVSLALHIIMFDQSFAVFQLHKNRRSSLDAHNAPLLPFTTAELQIAIFALSFIYFICP